MEMKNGWFMVDDDCLQCCKNLDSRCYSFIQAVWLDTTPEDKGYPDKTYAICQDTIDLKNFFLRDLELAIAGFYDGLSDLEEKYQEPIGQLDQIIAECYFENNCLDDSCSIGGVYTWAEAEEIIQKWINEH